MGKFIRITGHRVTYSDASGAPAVGYKLYTCTPGTTTLANSYNARPPFIAGNLNANPIILDDRGQAVIYNDDALKLVFCSPTSTGVSDGVIQTDDYLGERQDDGIVDIVEADVGTTNNQYSGSVVPPYTSLDDGFSLAFIPDANNEDTLVTLPGQDSPTVFTGTGINDAVFTGPYEGSTPGSVFQVVIDGVGTPNTFKWRKDGGVYTSGVAILGNNTKQTISEGIKIAFAQSTGHTLTDLWSLTVQTPAVLDFCSITPNYLITKIIDGEAKPIDGGDMLAGYSAHLDCLPSELRWILLNPSIPVYEALIPSRVRRIVAVSDNITVDDIGKVVTSTATLTHTMPAASASGVPNSFFYFFHNGAIGTVATLDFGAYTVYGPGGYSGTTYDLYPGDSIQVHTNGVNWEILTATSPSPTIQVITTTSTYTKTPGTKTVMPFVWGGAGAGGGTDAGGGGTSSAGGGGAGGYAWEILDLTAVDTVAVTIGAGGTGVSQNDGNAGGTTSFGAYLSATGGAGGKKALAGASGVGGAGGAGSGGTNNLTGDAGSDGDAAVPAGGAGARSHIGMAGGEGGATTTVVGAGNTGTGFASGGAGSVGTIAAGGAGRPGLCIIFEFLG